MTPEQLAQLQEFLAAFQPATEIVTENKASLIEKSQADFLTIVKTGLISTRYLAYLALVLQLEEQFPQLQRFFDLTALWFWAVLVSGALFFSLAYHYISFAKFSLWETEHNFVVKLSWVDSSISSSQIGFSRILRVRLIHHFFPLLDKTT